MYRNFQNHQSVGSMFAALRFIQTPVFPDRYLLETYSSKRVFGVNAMYKAFSMKNARKKQNIVIFLFASACS